MSNDKFHYPQRSPPPEKNIPCVKRWGEVGLAKSRQKIKIIPPFAITRSVRTRLVLFITEYEAARQPNASPPIKLSRKERLFRYGLVFA